MKYKQPNTTAAGVHYTLDVQVSGFPSNYTRLLGFCSCSRDFKITYTGPCRIPLALKAIVRQVLEHVAVEDLGRIHCTGAWFPWVQLRLTQGCNA